MSQNKKKENNGTKKNDENAIAKTEVIAFRKSCNAKGTGLSHYILMDKKTK